MKKFISLVVAMIMLFALSASVIANPGQNPNQNPGSPTIAAGKYTISVTGGGNNLRIDVLLGKTVVHTPARAGNGTFNQTFVYDGWEFFIQVQGNSLRDSKITCLHDKGTTAVEVDAPTCVEDGLDKLLCNNCGIERGTKVVKALGHKYGPWRTVKAATCEEEGLAQKDCERDGCGDFKTKVIPKLECECVKFDCDVCEDDKTVGCIECDPRVPVVLAGFTVVKAQTGPNNYVYFDGVRQGIIRQSEGVGEFTMDGVTVLIDILNRGDNDEPFIIKAIRVTPISAVAA